MGQGRLIIPNDNYKVGALDNKGNVIIPFIYYQLGSVTTDNKIEYSKGEGGEHGFLDIDGNVIGHLSI